MMKLLHWLLFPFLWVGRGRSTAAFSIRHFILFGSLGVVVAGAVAQVTGSGPITASPTTGNVVVGISIPVDTGPCSAGAYTIPNTDNFALVKLNSAIDCTATLPASGSPLTLGAGTTLTVQNASNTTVVPILKQGTPVFSGNCGASSSTCADTFTVVNTGDLLIVDITASNTTATISSITDTAGNASTCAQVAFQSSTPSPLDGQWACPNTSATGSDTITVHFSAAVANAEVIVFELSGVATSSPSEVTNTVNQTSGTALNISTNGAPTQRGDFIYGSVAANAPTVAALQPVLFSGGDTFRSNAYIQANGTATYSINWTTGSSTTTSMTIAAYKAAHPVSIINLCPGSGTTLVGDTSAGCTPLPAGFSADLLWDGTNYQIVKVTPPATNNGPYADKTASFNMSLENCREPVALMNWISAIIITVPSGLPSTCVMWLEQVGSVAAQVAVSSGMVLESAANGVHTGVPFSQSNIAIRGNGAIANFGGTIAP